MELTTHVIRHESPLRLQKLRM